MRTDWNGDLEELYQSTEEMVELPIPTQVKRYVEGIRKQADELDRIIASYSKNRVLNRIPEENSDLLAGMNTWPDCNPGDWFYLAVQEATNSHAFQYKAGNYETWTGMNKNPDWTRYEH